MLISFQEYLKVFVGIFGLDEFLYTNLLKSSFFDLLDVRFLIIF